MTCLITRPWQSGIWGFEVLQLSQLPWKAHPKENQLLCKMPTSLPCCEKPRPSCRERAVKGHRGAVQDVRPCGCEESPH